MKKKVRVIEVEWTGPHTVQEVIETFNGPTDCGLYQIYGTHTIFGSDSLLYIGKVSSGKTDAQTFSKRIGEHKEWLLEWQHSDIQIYLGRLGGVKKNTRDEWNDLIDKAERLLIFFSTPPENAQFLNTYEGHKMTISKTVVINWGKRRRLPLEVSTLFDDSEYGEDMWKIYGGDHLRESLL